ncbi:ATP-dependent dethiobiotin synthetase BioD [Psychrosphaera saromensis]|uniref:ATP-dependent dethiobiotin synthetase BioD n=1 Tax=Psychrosphaera saromensis TaxID=716813 RepID=A0A2S7UX83_9GAMM|nr:dethiobiotin synthase [Psychrosphaera saromensis]PQJ54389.1 dethiobiotin synthase [Psychrosphaera saromensis]GHB60380.1 ATP-dependent dethiobiotin synthetase BioD [Psychrosphaera saromensis]GLQ14599.1 ATP-dependent dethiobiotin synthetase BioD [Psychrosphaera saromensis]
MNITELFTQHKKVFITGTDTEVGKTYCASLMVKTLLKSGLDVFPFKPISAGVKDHIDLAVKGSKLNSTLGHKCNRTCGHFIVKANEDAVSLWSAVQGRYSLEQINPIVFQQPIAPHIAAKSENKVLGFERLNKAFSDVETLGDVQVIEGAGGWYLPLNDTELLSDWVALQKLPVVLVVGIKLGCLNHALLTAHAIEQSGCELIGWIANFIDGSNAIADENMAFLQQKLNAPLISKVYKNQTIMAAS